MLLGSAGATASMYGVPWNTTAYNCTVTHSLMMFQKAKKKKMFANVTFMLHCSVEVSFNMFLNFGQLCRFEIYRGTEWAVKITAAFITFL